MRLRFRGDGKKIIQGIAHEFHKGETIDLPDNIAKDLLKTDRIWFEEDIENPIGAEIIDINLPKKKKKEA